MESRLSTSVLGRTGLEVTRLGYGAMEVRGGPRGRSITDEAAAGILNAVLDAGINYIDTSIDYGRSEELIGEHISHRRSEFYLASKCGCPVGDAAPGEHIFTRENIVAGVDQSLSRMKTNYLDAVQFHSSPSKDLIEEEDAIQTLLDLKQAGKIRFLGSSSTLPNLVDHVAMGVFDLFQIPYSALSREHEDWITRAAKAGAGIVIRGGVAKGEPGEGGGRADTWDNFNKADLDGLREEGETPTAFMLRFTLSHPDLHTTIVGTLNPGHLSNNVLAAQKGPLPSDTYEEAKRLLSSAGVAPTV
jgi:aryl-alcohol dehydrogenase-like predicted oxidoreductase